MKWVLLLLGRSCQVGGCARRASSPYVPGRCQVALGARSCARSPPAPGRRQVGPMPGAPGRACARRARSVCAPGAPGRQVAFQDHVRNLRFEVLIDCRPKVQEQAILSRCYSLHNAKWYVQAEFHSGEWRVGALCHDSSQLRTLRCTRR